MVSVAPFLSSSEFADVELHLHDETCPRSVRISAHKLVLSATSDLLRGELYFAEHFHDTPVAELHIDVEPGVCAEEFIKGLYTGGQYLKGIIREENAIGWLLTASRFGATQVLHQVDEIMIDMINLDTVIQLASVAARAGAPRLFERSAAFIAENFCRFDTEDFEGIDTLVLKKVLKREAIYSTSEDQLLDVVCRYAPQLTTYIAAREVLNRRKIAGLNVDENRIRFSMGTVFDWKIRNFSRIEHQIRSPKFSDQYGHSWTALLYPAHTKTPVPSVAIYLYAHADGQAHNFVPRIARFKLKIIHPKQYSKSVGFESVAHTFSRHYSNFGWSSITNTKRAHEEFLEDDALTVRICVSITQRG